MFNQQFNKGSCSLMRAVTALWNLGHGRSSWDIQARLCCERCCFPPEERIIDWAQRESWVKSGYKDGARTAAVTSALCTWIWEGHPEPTGAARAQVDLRNQNKKALSTADGPAPQMSLSILCGHRKLYVSFAMSHIGIVSFRWRWEIHSFNYALIESDWLISKGRRRWGLISTPFKLHVLLEMTALIASLSNLELSWVLNVWERSH